MGQPQSCSEALVVELPPTVAAALGLVTTIEHRCSMGSLRWEVPRNFLFLGKRVGNFLTSGIPEFREFPVAREFPEIREFPGKIPGKFPYLGNFPWFRNFPRYGKFPSPRKFPYLGKFLGNFPGNFPGKFPRYGKFPGGKFPRPHGREGTGISR